MTRRRIAVLAASVLVVVAAILCLCPWLWPRTKLTPVRSNFAGLAMSTDFTVAERGSHTIALFRVDVSGELKKLGTHEVKGAPQAYVAPGAGEWYAIREGLWQSRDIRVYCAGRLEYAVPDRLLRWGIREIGQAAVLPDGRLLAIYRHPPVGIDPPPEEEIPIIATAILAREGNTLRRYPLVADLTLDTWAVAISGDGSVVAVSVAPHVKARDARNPKGLQTRFFTTKDAKPITTIEGFRVIALNTDGSLALGTREKSLAAYRGTTLIAEHPRTIFVRKMSPDGAFAAGTRLRYEAVVMKADTLEDVQLIKLTPPFEVGDYDVSTTGRLAVLEVSMWQTKPHGWRATSRLVVYRRDGTVAFRREFPNRVPIVAFQWTRDGKALHYLDANENRVVRCPVAE